MRSVLIFFLLVTPVFGASIPPAVTPPIVPSRSSTLPMFDFKKEIPMIGPEEKKNRQNVAPNLNPTLDQIIRLSQLDMQLHAIMPWVYAHGRQVEISDYEDAVESLAIAEHCLIEAMEGMIDYKKNSLELDPLVITAKLALDDSELVLMYLRHVSQLFS